MSEKDLIKRNALYKLEELREFAKFEPQSLCRMIKENYFTKDEEQEIMPQLNDIKKQYHFE